MQVIDPGRTPMTKNGQTVCVLDGHDAVIGYTYPNRAKGLVKKRRAEFVSDECIRLYRRCPTYEDMENGTKILTKATRQYLTAS